MALLRFCVGHSAGPDAGLQRSLLATPVYALLLFLSQWPGQSKIVMRQRGLVALSWSVETSLLFGCPTQPIRPGSRLDMTGSFHRFQIDNRYSILRPYRNVRLRSVGLH